MKEVDYKIHSLYLLFERMNWLLLCNHHFRDWLFLSSLQLWQDELCFTIIIGTNQSQMKDQMVSTPVTAQPYRTEIQSSCYGFPTLLKMSPTVTSF